MIDRAEIFRTYEKYGWRLRRLLAPAQSRTFVEASEKNVPIDEFALEAAWLSREPKPGQVAWELRYMGDPPFALLQSFDENKPDFLSKRQAVEMRLTQALKKQA